jgi:hypothetical protein
MSDPIGRNAQQYARKEFHEKLLDDLYQFQILLQKRDWNFQNANEGEQEIIIKMIELLEEIKTEEFNNAN